MRGEEKGGWETGNRSCETGYRGRETRSRAPRQGIEDGIQGADSGQRTVGTIFKNLVLKALETIRIRFL